MEVAISSMLQVTTRFETENHFEAWTYYSNVLETEHDVRTETRLSSFIMTGIKIRISYLVYVLIYPLF